MRQRKWMFCSVVVLLLFVVVAGCTNLGSPREISSEDVRKEQPGSTFLKLKMIKLRQCVKMFPYCGKVSCEYGR